MILENEQGGLTIAVIYQDGHSDCVETDLYLHACAGIQINGEDFGTDVQITLRGKDARDAFHDIILGKTVLEATKDKQHFLETQLFEIKCLRTEAMLLNAPEDVVVWDDVDCAEIDDDAQEWLTGPQAADAKGTMQ